MTNNSFGINLPQKICYLLKTIVVVVTIKMCVILKAFLLHRIWGGTGFSC